MKAGSWDRWKRQKIGLELEYPARDIDPLNWTLFRGPVAVVSMPLLIRVPISISRSSVRGPSVLMKDQVTVAGHGLGVSSAFPSPADAASSPRLNKYFNCSGN